MNQLSNLNQCLRAVIVGEVADIMRRAKKGSSKVILEPGEIYNKGRTKDKKQQNS